MSGKFRICFVLSLSLFCFFQPAFAQDDLPVKEKLNVNGYNFFNSIDTKQIIGLRLKARADLYYNKKKFANAIKYYEEASRYLPGEADIFFNLGNIYKEEAIFNMAAVYYKMAYEKYLLPENFNKTQKYYYFSLIRYAISLSKVKDINNDNEKKAKEVLSGLMDQEKEFTVKFPETVQEYSNLNKLIYGDVMIINKQK